MLKDNIIDIFIQVDSFHKFQTLLKKLQFTNVAMQVHGQQPASLTIKIAISLMTADCSLY